MHGHWIPLSDGGFVIIDDPLPAGSEWRVRWLNRVRIPEGERSESDSED